MVNHQQYAPNKSVVFSQRLGDEKWCVFNVSHQGFTTTAGTLTCFCKPRFGSSWFLGAVDMVGWLITLAFPDSVDVSMMFFYNHPIDWEELSRI